MLKIKDNVDLRTLNCNTPIRLDNLYDLIKDDLVEKVE